jgi:Ni/Co efflux regulator RcnB
MDPWRRHGPRATRPRSCLGPHCAAARLPWRPPRGRPARRLWRARRARERTSRRPGLGPASLQRLLGRYNGAPQAPAYQTPGYRPGFTPWRRGSFLPPSYQSFIVADAERFHLRRPPYGYHWVHIGEEFLLVSSSTGLIFDVVTGD